VPFTDFDLCHGYARGILMRFFIIMRRVEFSALKLAWTISRSLGGVFRVLTCPSPLMFFRKPKKSKKKNL
jgi:hypothetical protein